MRMRVLPVLFVSAVGFSGGAAAQGAIRTLQLETYLDMEDVSNPQISPDGEWLAYLSSQAGPYQIKVRPFPDVDRREWVISSSGDSYDARWSSGGEALLYRRGWGQLMYMPVTAGDKFAPGVARELIEIDAHDSSGSSFAVSPDGKRVLVNKPVDVSLKDETPVTLVTGWAGEVARAAPHQ